MREVQVPEASEQLMELLDAVQAGVSVAIRRNGEDVAFLLPACDRDRIERFVAVEKFLRMRAEAGPIDTTLEEMMAWRHEGHRY